MNARLTSDAKLQLIEATLSSIEKHGLCETSVATVTEMAGMSRGMVTYWFASKTKMLIEAYEYLLEKWNVIFFAQGGDTPEERIIRKVECMFAPPNFDPRGVRAWIAFSVAALNDKRLNKVCRRAYATWRSLLVEEFEAYARGHRTDIDAETFAATVMALADGLWLRSQVEPDVIKPERAREICSTTIYKLLGTRPR